jgi:5-methylcytosine-specific restriction enzyme subunit McrC
MRAVVAGDSPVVLEEYESVRVTGLRPSPTDIDAAGSGELGKRLTLRWLRDGTLEVVAGSHVGVVNLDCVSINVRPKLAGRELAVLQMLDYASGLSALRHLEQFQHLGEGLDLRDLVCLLLTREADRLLRHGLRRDYLRREEALPAVRGRLLPDRQILRRYGQLDRLECRYDELSSDILDNRLCSAALQVAARTATDSTVRASARRLAGDFTDVCTTDAFDATKAEERLSYHRGNEHYRSAHRWALLLLRGTAFSDLYAVSGPSSQAFMLDMNLLFERFVTRLLQDAARGTGIKVRTQDPSAGPSATRTAVATPPSPPTSSSYADTEPEPGGALSTRSTSSTRTTRSHRVICTRASPTPKPSAIPPTKRHPRRSSSMPATATSHRGA